MLLQKTEHFYIMAYQQKTGKISTVKRLLSEGGKGYKNVIEGKFNWWGVLNFFPESLELLLNNLNKEQKDHCLSKSEAIYLPDLWRLYVTFSFPKMAQNNHN